MYILLIILHIIVCFILIAVILLQAGKGGGLTEAFGGERTQAVLGTQAPAVLKKATTAAAIVFLLTSLILGMVTARRGRSLLRNMRIPVQVDIPAKQETAPLPVPDKTGEEKQAVEQPAEETEAQPVAGEPDK